MVNKLKLQIHTEPRQLLLAPVPLSPLFLLGLIVCPKSRAGFFYSTFLYSDLVTVTTLGENIKLSPIISMIASLGSSVWIDRHRRTMSRSDGPVVDPLSTNVVGSVNEFSTWLSTVLHDHYDPGIEMSLRIIDIG